MQQPELTILIPTLPERKAMCDRLIMALENQCIGDGYIKALVLTYETPRWTEGGTAPTTGAKRNKLVADCITKYCAFFDDDDMPTFTYIDSLLEGIAKGVDVVTFKGQMITNHNITEEFEFKLGHPYDDIQVSRTKKFYRRPPNHLCCIRTDIMKNFPFPDVTYGEDYKQCTAMQEAGVLKSEHHVPKPLYYYNFLANKKY